MAEAEKILILTVSIKRKEPHLWLCLKLQISKKYTVHVSGETRYRRFQMLHFLFHLTIIFSCKNKWKINIISQAEGIQQIKILKNKSRFFLRNADISFSVRYTIFFPSRRTSPDVGRSRDARIFSKVVLPEPDSPIIATNSPSSTENPPDCEGS